MQVTRQKASLSQRRQIVNGLVIKVLGRGGGSYGWPRHQPQGVVDSPCCLSGSRHVAKTRCSDDTRVEEPGVSNWTIIEGNSVLPLKVPRRGLG